MITCRWASRRLRWYLDRDPSALLTDAELRRLDAHLTTCEKCEMLSAEYGWIAGLLARLAVTCEPEPVAIERVRRRLGRDLMDDEG